MIPVLFGIHVFEWTFRQYKQLHNHYFYMKHGCFFTHLYKQVENIAIAIGYTS